MNRPVPFEYAMVRAVPRVERGEFVNVGVVLYCQAHDFLACTRHTEPTRILALDPGTDLGAVDAALSGICSVCEGAPTTGVIGGQPLRARFGWLTAPRSTVMQTGPVHSGLTHDPAAELAGLHRRFVLLPRPVPDPS